MNRFRPCHRLFMCALALAVSVPVCAQSGYPTRPIRVVVPFAAGSTTDIIARAISDRMAQALGQPLLVENRAGASGTIGQAHARRRMATRCFMAPTARRASTRRCTASYASTRRATCCRCLR